jgi:putative hemolysin
MLHEIGRQREITFRAAGEGTGRALDLDDFDQNYFHLFAYNKKQHELMGAYRLGLTDELLRDKGLGGLYSSTLFKYAPDVFEKLGPTIELGRSFVCPNYQKTSRTLLWLWKGIANFVAARPRYRTLLGPVSVSAEYVNFSRELMVRVLSGSTHRHPLHKSVRAKNPVRARSFGAGGLGDPRAVLTTPSDLSAVVSDAEVDRKGLPVLLREYLKLGGKFLGFNLDHEFSNVIDGLVVVDLMQTDRRVLQFYMGRALEAFVEYHTAQDALRESA